MAKGKKTGGRDFKPGNKFGQGAPTIPQDLREVRQLTAAEFVRLVNKYLGMTREEILKRAKSDPTTPALELMIASLMSAAINEGDHKRIDFILDRIVGKVANNIQLTGAGGAPVGVNVFSPDQVAKMAEQVLKKKKANE